MGSEMCIRDRGNTARGLFDLPGLDTLAQRVQLQIDDIRAVGEDWRISATLANGNST